MNSLEIFCKLQKVSGPIFLWIMQALVGVVLTYIGNQSDQNSSLTKMEQKKLGHYSFIKLLRLEVTFLRQL